MKRLLRFSPFTLGWLALACMIMPLAAQVAQVDQNAAVFGPSYQRGVNLSSLRGAPGKSPANAAQGTDGRAPAGGTPYQFQGVVTYGAVVIPAPNAALQSGKNYEQNAVPLNLPRGKENGNTTMVLRSAQAGAATFSQSVSFFFGSIITPPSTDENGMLLNNVAPTQYWAQEPYTNSSNPGTGYYYSPNSGQVFATVSGPVQIIWRKNDASPTTLNTTNKVTIGGLDYALTNSSYIVSGAAAKPPRKLYWTEKSFAGTGKAVSIPAASIGAVYFAYNPAMPRTVATEFADGNSNPGAGTTNATLPELRTIWYDSAQGLILAYNTEGRVFVELQGDPTPNGAREHLGYEIVDVFQQPVSQPKIAELGEKIAAYSDGQSDAALIPSPLQSTLSSSFLYQDSSGSSGRTEYYAAAETSNPNDVLVHWLEAGEVGLRWPAVFNRYQLIWPDDPGKYSHYLRPPVATANEAALTAVQLPANNTPALQYQDRLDYPRAVLDEASKFYTFLDAGQPSHRALLRFSSGSAVAFERVMSSLSSSLLRGTNSAFADVKGVLPRSGHDSALRFDGSGYGQLAGSSYFPAGSYTIESWVRVESQSQDSQLLSFTEASGQGPVITATPGTSLKPNTSVSVPNWQVKVVVANVGLSNLDITESVLTNASQQLSVYQTNTVSINYVGGGRFTGDIPMPGIGTANDNIAIEATGYVTIPTAGKWTFGVNSDDGFRLTIGSFTSEFNASRGASDTLGGYNFSAPGVYPIRLIYFQGSGGRSVEAFAAPGSFGSFSDGNGTFRLIGDVASGGLMVNSTSWVQSSQPLPQNDWAHLASVYQAGSSNITLYINGVPVGTGTMAQGPLTASTFTNLIGRGLIGSVDSFRIWSVAKTAEQLQAAMLVNSYAAGTEGLQVQFTFDEGGAVAYDSSGGDRHMTLVGGAKPSSASLAQESSPRYLNKTAYVGDRINPPNGEEGSSTGTYMAGYILQSSGTSFSPAAYKDPFTSGFSMANQGAIIPVNAIPGSNTLEVWWFRQNATNTIRNASKGFEPIYWPAVIGRYSLAWPENEENQIVMASNAGSGSLPSLQARGIIYTQNDSRAVGYNPNEEHAVLLAGQAYALRDDLNITTGSDYSSHPYVLLSYTEQDGRPAMRPFKVFREIPARGLVFDYVVEAGLQVQAPMPLPVLALPLENITASATNIYTTNYNTEIIVSNGDLPAGWSATETNGMFGNYNSFTYRDRKHGFWVMRGIHAGLPPLAAGTYSSSGNTFASAMIVGGALGASTTNYIHTSRRIASLVCSVAPETPLPAGITFGPLHDGLAVYGTWTA
ncbi:MAG: LamG-like jellyroll fold domain-containing protein, partial [Verrucomicrobiales bacterium]